MQTISDLPPEAKFEFDMLAYRFWNELTPKQQAYVLKRRLPYLADDCAESERWKLWALATILDKGETECARLWYAVDAFIKPKVSHPQCPFAAMPYLPSDVPRKHDPWGQTQGFHCEAILARWDVIPLPPHIDEALRFPFDDIELHIQGVKDYIYTELPSYKQIAIDDVIIDGESWGFRQLMHFMYDSELKGIPAGNYDDETRRRWEQHLGTIQPLFFVIIKCHLAGSELSRPFQWEFHPQSILLDHNVTNEITFEIERIERFF